MSIALGIGARIAAAFVGVMFLAVAHENKTLIAGAVATLVSGAFFALAILGGVP